MGKIGTVKIQTPNGVQEVYVYDTADVDYPVVRVQTPSGVGAFKLIDPAYSTHPYLRVQTASGVKSITNTSYITRDTFEDGDMAEYSEVSGDSSTNEIGTETSSAPDGGSYNGYSSNKEGSGTKAVAQTDNTWNWDTNYQFRLLVRMGNFDGSDQDYDTASFGWRTNGLIEATI